MDDIYDRNLLMVLLHNLPDLFTLDEIQFEPYQLLSTLLINS